MELQYSGTIAVPVDEAWATLSRLDRVAACVPGVRLDPHQEDPDAVTGIVTVPLGPLRLTYRGEASFVERDPEARRAVIDAAGRDSHGEQAASARITVELREAGPAATTVTAAAEVTVRGMSAPVGFAVGEFGTGLLRQFVGRLGAREPVVAGRGSAVGRVPAPETRPQPVPPPAHTPEEAVYPVAPPGEPMSALVPLAGTLAVGIIVGWLLARRRSR
jgi:carbon monoxide dehydrogenase subunit G